MDRIEELKEKKKKIREGGDPETKKRLFYDKGLLPPRQRIEKLLDPGSFLELDMLATHHYREFGMDKRKIPAEGVITGYGKINGRMVCVYAQDFAALGGTYGEMHGRKICALMDMAAEVGVPVIGICHSGGLRLHETLGPMEMFGQLFRRNSQYSGVVPQISIILGVVAGGQAYSPGLTDFILMTRESAVYIAGPAFVKAQTGREITDQELGGAQMHARKSGLVDVLTDTEQEIFEETRRLLDFLPLNCHESPPRKENDDDPQRYDDALNHLVPEASQIPFDMHEVITPIFDHGDFQEMKPAFAANMITGFARLGGNTVGVVANQPKHLGGVIDIKAAEKGARFVRFCDAFNIPIVTFQDSPGYLIGKEMEEGGMIYKGAKLLHAYAEATVPKVTVIVRKAYAGAYIAMGSQYIGADLVYAWPGAEISSVAPKTAASIVFRKEMAKAKDEKEMEALFAYYHENYVNAYRAASLRHINDIIEPGETRSVLIKSMELMKGKKEVRPARKHGNIPL
ncbi:MAG: acyl-CoA carboxylase subunit beta [Deltaproteobacteria bacterium]|nr:acyl-CoA carboxylase subunit beta [Deltaproteobacteria bacterium]MBW1922677.1 acyl-CoA carboxylase subunit beta [Deltaproteobacteria bacterium]MBW2007648.1 acyl-CoA carboxylase subunit beta [Deltaproteobacteria bacterium]RLB37590.1 MAG: methylmalonyl-CoA carboxyltransferase [Deltaproteobacteria bacterium]